MEVTVLVDSNLVVQTRFAAEFAEDEHTKDEWHTVVSAHNVQYNKESLTLEEELPDTSAQHSTFYALDCDITTIEQLQESGGKLLSLELDSNIVVYCEDMQAWCAHSLTKASKVCNAPVGATPSL